MSKSLGKTIQIFCPAGEPRGVRIAEITTRIVQAVVVPRAQLVEGLARPELSGVGLYFLFGESEASGRPVVYVGEAEDCGQRLRKHNQEKDFWTVAVAIVSRTGSFTKAHVRLLEWLSIERAKQAQRYVLDNGNSGIQPTVPEWMECDVAEVFETAEVLLSSTGFPVFETLGAAPAGEQPRVFVCRRRDADARGVYSSEGMVVKAGSKLAPGFTPSAYDWIKSKRQELITSGVVVDLAGQMTFSKDSLFETPSNAAAVVIGSNVNGWTEWRDDQGRTLDQVFRAAKVS